VILENEVLARGGWLLTSTEPTLPYRQVALKLEPNGELLRCWGLEGGVSAQVTAIEIGLPNGSSVRAVVRRFGPADLQRNPHLARDQFDLLMGLHRGGLAVPKPLLFDESRTVFDVPFLVLEYIEGSPELAPQDVENGIRQMAAHLARIHRIPETASTVSMLPRIEQTCLAELGPSAAHSACRPRDLAEQPTGEESIREILRSMMPLARRNLPALLHGDYWPGNVVWKDGRLAAIIDWEDAAVGDPLADVSNARLEILWAFGSARMEDFIRHYREHMPEIDLTDLPYWDLYAALRLAPSKFAGWGLGPEKEAIMRERHPEFVEQALRGLSGPSGSPRDSGGLRMSDK
jgi:aminoglycoside phosphotransferase (APT) family kinase protein